MESINRREFFSRVEGFIGGVIGLSFLNGCDRTHNKYLKFESHPVDQVFRDHNGFRLLYTDENSVLIERKYEGPLSYPNDRVIGTGDLEGAPEDITKKFKYFFIGRDYDLVGRGNCFITIVKDLENNERGFASSLTYELVKEMESNKELTYTEVHLPKDREISPGNESFGGRLQLESPIHKVK